MLTLLEKITKSLDGVYSSREIKSISRILCQDLLSIGDTDYFLKNSINLDYSRNKLFHNALERLKRGEPIQYVVGSVDFCGIQLTVDRRALIPRPETSELVEWILRNNSQDPAKLLDIGTGSGCVAIAISAQRPNWSVTGWDISPQALALAVENNKTNHTSAIFQECNILSNPECSNLFDLIVSNPPYITGSEKQGMEINVLDWEPELALFVPDNNPLLFYSAIAGFAKKNLRIGGTLYFEINPLFARNLVNFLKTGGFSNIVVKKDISGKERMIKAVWHND
jgi:release factor glutamine methyltransferase